ncbi:MAG: serine protease [Myxococcota bacterium]
MLDVLALPFALALAFTPTLAHAAEPAPDDPEAAFEALTGADLVWSRGEIPDEVLFDRTPPLPVEKRAAAARILLREARKYPPRFFEHVHLRKIGVFAACVSDHGDGFRAFDDQLGGYRYFGQWAPDAGGAPKGALIAAYYSDSQLPQTFHHEVFHHIDASLRGDVDYGHFESDDERFHAAVDGSKPYAAPALSAAIVKELSERSRGEELEGALGSYAAKSAGEDQAEAARWLMTHLPDAFDQIAHHPALAGSQRLLHLLTQYADAAKGSPKADLAWFVGLAVGHPVSADALTVEPERAPDGAGPGSRAWLEAQARLARRGKATAAAQAIAQATVALTRERIQPRAGDREFTVWTPERFQGGANPVLQADVRQIAADAARLDAWADADPAARKTLRAAQDELVRLLESYRRFIAERWELSAPTTRSFDEARAIMRGALLDEAPGRAPIAPIARDNPHLAKVAAAVKDPAWAAIIKTVQPAAVKIGGGSGVNLLASGLVMTNAHVAEHVGDRLDVAFPDGTHYSGETIASDHHADLALVRLEGAPDDLPTAPVAARAPVVGDPVCVIGQPGKYTPDGEPTGYDGWHVSVGKIRGFLDDIYGPQGLGRTKHDAWTYWGHSGSPLFDRHGAIAALHNSWDSKTAMRHAVPHEVIVRFLAAQGVDVARR